MIAQKEIAAALGVSEASVSDYVRRGMPTDSINAAAAWRMANVRQRAGGDHHVNGQAGGAAQQYHDARALREVEEARMARMRREELEGALIRVEAVRTVAAAAFAATRESLLQIPARMSTVLAAETSAAVVHELLQREINQAMAQLAGLSERWRDVEYEGGMGALGEDAPGQAAAPGPCAGGAA